MIGRQLSEQYAAASADELAMALFLSGLAIVRHRRLLPVEFVDTLIGLQQWPTLPDLSQRSHMPQTFALTLHRLIEASGAKGDTVRAAVRRVIAGTVMGTEPWPPTPEPDPRRVGQIIETATAELRRRLS